MTTRPKKNFRTIFCPDNYFVRTKGHLPPSRILPPPTTVPWFCPYNQISEWVYISVINFFKGISSVKIVLFVSQFGWGRVERGGPSCMEDLILHSHNYATIPSCTLPYLNIFAKIDRVNSGNTFQEIQSTENMFSAFRYARHGCNVDSNRKTPLRERCNCYTCYG